MPSLKKIAGDDELDTTKRPAVVSNGSRYLLQLVKQVAIHHGDLIHDEYFGA